MSDAALPQPARAAPDQRVAAQAADRGPQIEAVLFDFGGVIVSGPFESFNRFEVRHGLPHNFIRSVNATNPHDNAWARLERNDITFDEFNTAFAAETEALGHRVGGAELFEGLEGGVHPEMVVALQKVKDAGYRVACLTNNIVSGGEPRASDSVIAMFDQVVESSKVGARKPEVRFYELACELVGVGPDACVFLDDLGINLKPARAMGMTTIKVLNADQAITDLEDILGTSLR